MGRLAEERACKLKAASRVAAIDRQLADLAADEQIRPDEKARMAYTRARRLLETVIDQPTAECIGATKKAVGRVVDMILSDDETAGSLLRVSQHDHSTYTHSVNVGVYAVMLATRLYGRRSSHDLKELGAAFFLHDLGKTCISPTILNKTGNLTEREKLSIRAHPYRTYAILAEVNQASEQCRLIALQHHERDNGTGYPQGRRGSEIHEYARICSIADVFDALVSQRPYKESVSPYRALEIMRDEMIGHFHRELLENFVMIFAKRAAG
jgi:HD-GYP domain-containing protein (c-di-GMP phosphodiesterase class II)